MAAEPTGPEALAPLVEAGLATPGADEVEVTVSHRWGGLTRFARSAIHQHVASDDLTVSVRVGVAMRVGAASTNDATPEGVAAAGAAAVRAARLTPPDPGYPGVATAASVPEVGLRFDPASAAARPERRAEAVAELLGRSRPGQAVAGAVETVASEVVIATSAGARHHGMATRASASAVAMGGGASGHAEQSAVGLDAIDAGDVGERSAETCARAVGPAEVEPGDWEVVLLPSAVMTLMEYLAFITFSAKAYAEERSAFSGHLGELVAAPVVSIADDALSSGAIGLPFDDEGMPRRRVELITAGVATGVVHDRASAHAAGTTSTGHGLPGPNPYGPLARHLVLAPGQSSLDELVAGVERGLVVTRLWYARSVNAKQTLITGMTRDGTFLVEGGQVGPPVRNLRFNQSILGALATCDGVGDTLASCSDELSDSRVPAVRLRSFTFTSATDH